ncbi:hypothetical protein HD553DRAFT_335314 [Filobasidium floriforme]|uniref:uncharacterized protein n=1 Tax=Filobasidium floriforme TaxID=5210 RepID=UPI001E8E732B|nr:uncharacterized protein HD553DRAFT_335314 [Filobasidium floriforme]KAH8084604.1 hypothetical protein HD553DRAFT_335314 [Filobasidium floriforme]
MLPSPSTAPSDSTLREEGLGSTGKKRRPSGSSLEDMTSKLLKIDLSDQCQSENSSQSSIRSVTHDDSFTFSTQRDPEQRPASTQDQGQSIRCIDHNQVFEGQEAAVLCRKLYTAAATHLKLTEPKNLLLVCKRFEQVFHIDGQELRQGRSVALRLKHAISSFTAEEITTIDQIWNMKGNSSLKLSLGQDPNVPDYCVIRPKLSYDGQDHQEGFVFKSVTPCSPFSKDRNKELLFQTMTSLRVLSLLTRGKYLMISFCSVCYSAERATSSRYDWAGQIICGGVLVVGLTIKIDCKDDLTIICAKHAISQCSGTFPDRSTSTVYRLVGRRKRG